MNSFKKRVSRKLSRQVSLLSDGGTTPKINKNRSVMIPKNFDSTSPLPKIVEKEDCEGHTHHHHESLLEPDTAAIIVGKDDIS